MANNKATPGASTLTPELIMQYMQDPSSVDFSRVTIDPGDIKMQMGRALTEEEFKKHCRDNNIAPQIVKSNPKTSKK
jgi:hypothetical protein